MIRRRTFLASTLLPALRAQPSTSKRRLMLDWLAGNGPRGYTPAAFFLHFAPEFKNGLPAAKKHMEFFRQTGMDFVKIQFEQTYQRQAFLERPGDWAKLKLEKADFYEPLLVTVRELVREAKKDALILMTLYSPYMCAGHCATAPVLKRHLSENPDAVKRGLDILTESQMIFVRACIDAGIDGFYMSTQGSETGQFSDPTIFTKYVKRYDLVAMKHAASTLPFNILHVCDYHAPYAGYQAVLDYPGQVVNLNFHLAGGRHIEPTEAARLFQRPIMGGLDRHGTLVKGTPAQIEAEVKKVLKTAPPRFLLGADCTVGADTDWARIRRAIATAHGA